jgi:hypothetical protein
LIPPKGKFNAFVRSDRFPDALRALLRFSGTTVEESSSQPQLSMKAGKSRPGFEALRHFGNVPN